MESLNYWQVGNIVVLAKEALIKKKRKQGIR
jgi:hypothetical protein